MKLWVLLLLLVSFSFSITLDPYLLQHSIYAKTFIAMNNESTFPNAGIIGTPGVLGYTGGWKHKLYTSLIADTLTGTANVVLDDGTNIPGIFDPGTTYGMWEQMTVYAGGSVEYVDNEKNSDPTLSGGTLTQVSAVYTPQPALPDLSSIQFNGGSNITVKGSVHNPGHYGKLKVGCILTAGIYYFDEIDLPNNDTIYISSNNGDYSTEIYVKDHINIGEHAVLTPDDSKKGKGKIALILRGDEPEHKIDDLHVDGTLYLRDGCFVAATLIAPTSRVMLRNTASISGQVFANKIHFIGFDGGSDLEFIPLNQVNIVPKTQSFLETDGDTVIVVGLANDVPDSNGTIKWKFISGTADINTDLTSAYPKSGILTYIQGTNVSTEDIKLYIYDDNLAEPDETFILELYDASGNINLPTDPYPITITILENDQNTHPPVVQSDTLMCIENGSVVDTVTVIDPD